MDRSNEELALLREIRDEQRRMADALENGSALNREHFSIWQAEQAAFTAEWRQQQQAWNEANALQLAATRKWERERPLVLVLLILGTILATALIVYGVVKEQQPSDGHRDQSNIAVERVPFD